MKNKDSIDLDLFVELMIKESNRITKDIPFTSGLTKDEKRQYLKLKEQLDIIANTVRPITIW